MQLSSITSFTKFVIGFTFLVSVSLGITIAINSLASGQGAPAQQASAAVPATVYFAQ